MKPQATPEGQTLGSPKKAIVAAYLDATRDADALAFESICAPDFALHTPQPTARVARMDRAEAIAFLTTAPGLILDTKSLKFEITSAVETGDAYVIEVAVTGKSRSGQDYRNVYIMWFTFSGDLLSGCRQHVDTAYAAGLERFPTT